MTSKPPTLYFIAFFLIYANHINGDVDINVNQNTDELSVDGLIVTNEAELNSEKTVANDSENIDDVEINISSVPSANVSLGNRSGKLYQYDEFYGSLDGYPDYNNMYDYGECLHIYYDLQTNDSPTLRRKL